MTTRATVVSLGGKPIMRVRYSEESGTSVTLSATECRVIAEACQDAADGLSFGQRKILLDDITDKLAACATLAGQSPTPEAANHE